MIGLGQQFSPPLIVTGEQSRLLASERLRVAGIAMGGAAMLGPVDLNTAIAVTLAALATIENGDNPALVVTPADIASEAKKSAYVLPQ